MKVVSKDNKLYFQYEDQQIPVKCEQSLLASYYGLTEFALIDLKSVFKASEQFKCKPTIEEANIVIKAGVTIENINIDKVTADVEALQFKNCKVNYVDASCDTRIINHLYLENSIVETLEVKYGHPNMSNSTVVNYIGFNHNFYNSKIVNLFAKCKDIPGLYNRRTGRLDVIPETENEMLARLSGINREKLENADDKEVKKNVMKCEICGYENYRTAFVHDYCNDNKNKIVRCYNYEACCEEAEECCGICSECSGEQ